MVYLLLKLSYTKEGGENGKEEAHALAGWLQQNLSAQSRDAAWVDSSAMEFSGLVAGILSKRGMPGKRSVSPANFVKAPLPGGVGKDDPNFADFVMNLPTSDSWGAAAWVGNFSWIYIWKQNTEQVLAPRAAQTGMRPCGLQLQAGQACPLPPCWRQRQKFQLIFPR